MFPVPAAVDVGDGFELVVSVETVASDSLCISSLQWDRDS
jgi:hypothetical protein